MILVADVTNMQNEEKPSTYPPSTTNHTGTNLELNPALCSEEPAIDGIVTSNLRNQSVIAVFTKACDWHQHVAAAGRDSLLGTAQGRDPVGRFGRS